MGRPTHSQSVDRFIGVLVVVCASAAIVALSVRAGSSLSTILRVTLDTGDDSDAKARRRSRKRRPEHSGARGGGGASHADNKADDVTAPGEEQGDAYYTYAYGARSGRGSQGRGEGRLVLHVGSCHCGGLMFEVDAPEHLVALEGPSKVRYPFITVPPEHFRLTSDDSNGSLYLVKSSPSFGRHVNPKVSAHFFCRRCGVHVVHAPDFPHAAVANINVHCIQPETIASLAVGFRRGGGVELPGMGDPVEGMYEVSREAWSDVMRERVHAALEQQLPFGGREGARGSSTATSTSRDLSPVRRPPGFNSSRGTETAGVCGYRAGSMSGAEPETETETGVIGREFGDQTGAQGGDGAGVPTVKASRGGITTLGSGGAARRMPEMGSLLWEAEERDRAQEVRFSMPAAATATHVASGSMRGIRDSGSTWGDVLMHVVSLPSAPAAASSSLSSSSSCTNVSSAASAGATAPAATAAALRARRGDGFGAGRMNPPVGVVGSEEAARGRVQQRHRLEEDRRQGGAADGRAAANGEAGVGEATGCLPPLDGSMRRARASSRRRSSSMDSASATPAAVDSSPGAQGVTSHDGLEASGGECSSTADRVSSGGSRLGRGGASHGEGDAEGREVVRGEEPGTKSGVASGWPEATPASFASRASPEGTESDTSAEVSSCGSQDGQPILVRPPPARRVSGGYAAPQA